MANIRTWAELKKWKLTPAEERLIEACKLNEQCPLGDRSLPAKGAPDPKPHINADVLRYLILSGCDNAASMTSVFGSKAHMWRGCSI